MAHHTATIDLIDAGTGPEVHLGILRPGVLTQTGTKHCGGIFCVQVFINR